MAAGIGMVHQHFMLVEVFSVAENLILGREQSTGGVLEHAAGPAAVRELSDRYRLSVDPDALIEDLPVGVQQRVEILKALANDATYLIFDEPTAVLTPQEIDELIDGDAVAAGRGQGDRLHHPQAARGTGDRRQDHRHPPGQGGRHRRSPSTPRPSWPS